MRLKVNDITIGKTTFRPLFGDLIRPLSASEKKALKESIKKHGILADVVVDGTFGVIDGLHRLEIASELGIPLKDVPLKTVPRLSDGEKESLCLSLNFDRRQSTIEEQEAARNKRVERIAKARKEGTSLRSIAEEEGISVVQVQRDIEKANGVGSGVPYGTPEHKEERKSDAAVRGRDGKQYARKAAPETRFEDDERPTDQLGIPIKGEMRKVFAACEQYSEIRNMIRTLSGMINKLAQSPGGEKYRGELRRREENGKESFREPLLDEVLGRLDHTEPRSSVCPWCHESKSGEPRKSCTTCKGRGWVTKGEWDNAGKKMQDAVAEACIPK